MYVVPSGGTGGWAPTGTDFDPTQPLGLGVVPLQTGTVFHYTLCATNAFGTRCDLSDHTFKTNAPPTASLKENKSSPGPLQVSFDGSGSFDPDGSKIRVCKKCGGDL